MQIVKGDWQGLSHAIVLFWQNLKPVDPTSHAVFTSSFSAKHKLLGSVTVSEAYEIAANSITEQKLYLCLE